MSSSSRYGSSRTTVEFSADVDINVAASDTRDALSRAVRDLPDDAGTPVVVKADSNAQDTMPDARDKYHQKCELVIVENLPNQSFALCHHRLGPQTRQYHCHQ